MDTVVPPELDALEEAEPEEELEELQAAAPRQTASGSASTAPFLAS